MVIGGSTIQRGSRETVHLPVAPMYTAMEMTMPVHVIRGKKDGPRLFVSAAIHGDEINGVEIIRRLLARPELSRLRGTLIAVPVVNVYGYTARSRYLPDRRDLNRSFPGSQTGSMASRLADTFMQEIVENATHGIDLHTGAVHRTNLPHVRVCFSQKESLELAQAFRVPLIMHSDLRDGSLRQAVVETDVPMLLYEAGEALRFDEQAIRVGLRGVLNVMRTIGMLPARRASRKQVQPLIAKSSRWMRAPDSGTLVSMCSVGDVVSEGQVLALVTDPLGREEIPIKARTAGVIVGATVLPLVYEGEALFNVAELETNRDAVGALERFESNLGVDPDLPPSLEAAQAHDPID
ncbi:MAG: succinylglutamate desuccinylase/aspartoacylase family protein [Rhodothermales bacterium]|nr:succinylglutamate desuccinylase/aspartoacylase family protein [Rhodothermales bacterium]